MSKGKSRKKNRVGAFVVIAAAGAALAGVLLFLLLRDRSVIIAVPASDRAAYEKALKDLVSRYPTVRPRLRTFDTQGPDILSGARPGLAVVSFVPWVAKAFDDGRLDALPAAAFRSSPEKLPRAFISAVGTAETGQPRALPIAYDPWMAAWHRDFIGGANAVPPRDWTTVVAAAGKWKKKGAPALALPGREQEAVLAWLVLLGSAAGPATAAEAFAGFPARGRQTVEDALVRLASLQRDSLLQKGSFSFPWSDATALVLQGRAAGILLPLSLYRGLNPVLTAPLIVVRVPDFSGPAGYGLIADLRVLVMPARGARGRGIEKVIAFFSEPGTQRSLADALGLVPARLDAPVRDGAAYEAMQAARGASVLIPLPGLALESDHARALAGAADTVLQNPSRVSETIAALYADR